MKKTLILLFYLINTALFAQQAGDIVSVEQKLDLTPSGVIQLISQSTGTEVDPNLMALFNSINTGLLAYKITYWTPDYDDNLVMATGLVMWPKSSKALSTVLYCHPTTDKRENVPSNLKDVATFGFVLPLAYAVSDYIVVAPDYYGYGDGDGIPNYTDVKTTAGSILDMMTAADTFLSGEQVARYDQNFICGYSLGGHAGMATIKKASEDNSYSFDYAYLGAGPHDLSWSTLQGGVIDKITYPYSAFLSYVTYTSDNLGYDLNNGDWHNVISDEYYDAFIEANVDQQYGLFWGPQIWRNLYQDNFIAEAEADINHPLRQYARANDVYDWYNKTPTTMSGGWFDRTIPIENNYKTKAVQRGYYPWWDWNKFKIKTFDVGPLEHFTGTVPWLLASIFEFNTHRIGGFFNLDAIDENDGTVANDEIVFERSSIESIISKNGKTLKTFPSSKLYRNSNESERVLIETVELPDRTVKTIPLIKEVAEEVEFSEMIQPVGKNSYVFNLHGLENEVKAVNTFRNGRRLNHIKATSDIEKGLPIVINDLQYNDVIEVVTKHVILTTEFKKETLDHNQREEIIVSQEGRVVTVMNTKLQFNKLEVVNQSGQIIQTDTHRTNQYTIILNQGMYFLRLVDENKKQSVKKVIVL